MKKSIVVASSFAVLMAGSCNVAAQEPFEGGYVGANYVFVNYEEEGFPEFDLGALVGKAGVKANPYFAAEMRVGIGAANDSTEVDGVTLDLDLDYLIGGYLIAGIPNESPIYPYAVVGLTTAKLTADASMGISQASVSDSSSDVSLGVGVNFAVADEALLNAEYMQYLDKDGVEISGVGLGVTILF